MPSVSTELLNRTSWLQTAIARTERYLQRAGYRGYDPFDALQSPVFRMPVLRSNRLLRWGGQQVLKRTPVNLRPVLRIRKGLNPVTVGLCLQAYAYLDASADGKQPFYRREIEKCIILLEKLQSRGFSGVCWGYDFDWEARYARMPAFTPTVVATGFITNALYEYWRLSADERALELCQSAVEFVRRDLNKTRRDDTFCYSYSPVDQQIVFNATMKGARLLAQVYAVSGDPELAEEAEATVAFVMAHQREDGAWAYSHGDRRTWVDNFHTAYVLDCLDAYIRYTGDARWSGHLEKGLSFYINNFFEDGAIPRYYDRALYPIDATAAAQSILTLTRFRHIDTARHVARWMVGNMMDKQGYFYYQKNLLYTNRIPYTRWSTAWMFLALAALDSSTD